MQGAGGGDDVGLPDPVALEKVRRLLDLSPTELYVRYIGVTGVASPGDVHAYLVGVGPALDLREHDKLVIVINECLRDRGLVDRLPFVER